MDLWYVMREPGGFLGFGYKSWEDCISSLIMIGPPGRAARSYNAKNFWERLCAFEIVLGAKAVGHIDNFRGSNPACEPTGLSGCTFNQRWDLPINLQRRSLVVSISAASVRNHPQVTQIDLTESA